MEKIELLVPNEGRKLKNIFSALLKKGFTNEIGVLNYAKSYVLDDKKLIKKEKKLVFFSVASGEVERALLFFEQVSGRKRASGELILR